MFEGVSIEETRAAHDKFLANYRDGDPIPDGFLLAHMLLELEAMKAAERLAEEGLA